LRLVLPTSRSISAQADATGFNLKSMVLALRNEIERQSIDFSDSAHKPASADTHDSPARLQCLRR